MNELSPSNPNPTPGVEQIDAELAALGAETQTQRKVKSVLPWAVSLAVHCGLVMIGMVVTWAVVTSHEEEPPPVLIVADFDAMQYDPLAVSGETTAQPRERLVEDRAASPTPSDRSGDAASATDVGPGPADVSRLFSRGAAGTASDFAPQASEGSATFVGIRSSNARRIAYVIDASGSMISSFQIIIEELARSLEALNPQQQFQVIFFQKNEAVVARGMDKLVPATPDERLATLQWIGDRNNILPQGRSNPLAAIEKALRLKPDVIFLLSENITGSGQFEIDQADLLALLEKLNPVDPETGRRITQINCVQFLDPDPLDTLRKIAEVHGGPKGYRFLDRRQLGISAP